MEHYEICDETLALIPIGEHQVHVYELNGSFVLDTTTTQIMEDSCRYFGSSLDGRKKGTEALIGVTYKAPIIVEETNSIIFFPMSSTRYKDTTWINLNHIVSYYRDMLGCVIQFENDQSILLDSSYGVVDNQILRATRLESALRGRKIHKKPFNLEK